MALLQLLIKKKRKSKKTQKKLVKPLLSKEPKKLCSMIVRMSLSRKKNASI